MQVEIVNGLSCKLSCVSILSIIVLPWSQVSKGSFITISLLLKGLKHLYFRICLVYQRLLVLHIRIKKAYIYWVYASPPKKINQKSEKYNPGSAEGFALTLLIAANAPGLVAVAPITPANVHLLWLHPGLWANTSINVLDLNIWTREKSTQLNSVQCSPFSVPRLRTYKNNAYFEK